MFFVPFSASVKSTPTENIASPLEAVQPASTTPSSPQATPGAAQSNAVSFDELGGQFGCSLRCGFHSVTYVFLG